MSTDKEKNPSRNECVDVDSSVKETGSVSETTEDSGVDSVELDSATHLTSPVSDPALPVTVSHIDNFKSNGKVEVTVDSFKDHDSVSLPTPTSISPDINDATENILSFDNFSLIETDPQSNETDHITTTKDDANLMEMPAEITVTNTVLSTNSSITDSTNDVQSNDLDMSDVKSLPSYQTSGLDINSRTFGTSTVSLNEQKTSLDAKNNSISKSPYSRSAENISTIDQKLDSVSLNSSTKELNAEKILSEFSIQKNKASATQKISPDDPSQDKVLPEIPHANLDVRYTRLPKELLPQDLGSIVKNVHGIFSSVSGSLKYAYNHTHRVTIPKPPVKLIKPIPNGKVMDEIFEDSIEKNTISNGNDKADLIPEHSEEISENEGREESDATRDVIKLQVESLERVLAEQRKENASLRERVKQHVDELQDKDQIFKELEVKVDLMSKRVEQAEREKDAAVMRYASVECAAIEAKRAAEKAAAAERAATAELELMNNKLKSAHSEKQRICQLYDDKCHELQTSERTIAKLQEQQRELEGRLKWTQSKLRMEMDAYKESAERAEKLSQQISELEAAKDVAAANASDSAKARQLEAELKESQAALILCRHEKEDLERRLSSTTQALEVCRRERDTATSALARTYTEVEQLKESNQRLEQEAAELAALRAQAALADTLSAQLQRESTRAAQAEQELSKERARAETCARREAAALEHAASLTASHVAQRARDTERDAKTQALSVDNASLRERVATLESEISRLQTTLTDETDRRHKENRVLARKVAELTEEAADANKKLEWEKGENLVLKKKHASAIKELNRELQRALKRCEQLEAKLPPDADSNRTGSISSLSSGESAPQEDRLHNGHTDTLPDIQVREPDRQALIERIVSLQRAAARRAERCEFLEEHSRQLTGELRAKSRLLRHLLCSLPAGAVASQDSDQHKKEIARLGGGAMAAVWGGDPTGMTLELSLEMNKRLQAVLEDSLLKNITLKENMDTLGEEIARLKDKKGTTPETK